MKRVGFATVEVKVERSTTEQEILETPTFLKKALINDDIDTNEYKRKMTAYKEAIKDKETLSELKTETQEQLREYQAKIVGYAKRFRAFAIFDEPRLGKTPTVIELIKEKGLINEKIFVIAPDKVINNWIKEIKKWANETAIKFEGEFYPETNIYISTYTRARLSMQEIIDWEPTISILDEAHVLRNSRGIRQRLTQAQREIFEGQGLLPINKSILKIGEAAKYRYVLSGTPGVNTAEDIFAILQFMMPYTFHSFWSFCYYYFKVNIEFFGGRKIEEYKSQEKIQEMQEMLDYISSNNKQKEAMPWLKPPTIKYEYLELTTTQRILEKRLIENSKIKDYYVLNSLEQMIHHITIVLNPTLLKQYQKGEITQKGCKHDYLMEFLEENKKSNIAIFSMRRENLESIKEDIRDRETYMITGKVTSKKSLEIQEEINKKSKKSGIILLGTIESCKEGITLEGLDKAIVTDQSWVPSTMEQLFNRLNATTPEAQEFFGEKEITILHVPNTTDDIVLEAIKHKKTKTQVVNDYKEYIKRRNKEWKNKKE